jgi:hypothetical protein
MKPRPDPQAYTLRLVLFAEGLAWFLPPRLGGFGAGGVLAVALFDRAPTDGFDHHWRPDATTYSEVAAVARVVVELAAGDGVVAAIVATATTGLAQRCVDPRPAQLPGLAAELARLASLAPAQQRAEREALPAELRRYLSLEQAATPPRVGRGAREGAPGMGVQPGASGLSALLAEFAEALSSHAHARPNRLDLQFTAKVQVDLLKGPTGARPWPASSSRPRRTSTRSR